MRSCSLRRLCPLRHMTSVQPLTQSLEETVTCSGRTTHLDVHCVCVSRTCVCVSFICCECVCYSHVHLAQVAVAVLDDMCVFGAVKHGDWTLVALGSDVAVSWVDGHGHHVDTQVTGEHDARALTHRSGL